MLPDAPPPSSPLLPPRPTAARPRPGADPLRASPAAAAAILLSPEAPSWSPELLMERVMAALVEQDGLPIHRASWLVPTLHPDVRTLQLIYRADSGVEVVSRRYGGAAFTTSPLRTIAEGRADWLHLPIAAAGPRAYTLLDELAEQGYVDYVVAAVPTGDLYEKAPVSWATRSPEGFTEAHLQAFDAHLALLTLMLRLHAHRSRGRSLLQTYIGADAAERVLSGHIRRGALVELDAAICFCDLRGFTALSEALPSAELIELLNEVFDVVVRATEAEAGDVLKFIGDAVLVVFRVGEGPGAAAEACARAARAAASALAGVEALSARRQAEGRAAAAVGFGLHLGRAAYGNVGGATRLDFTVIGADVNLTSRLEGLSGPMGAGIVASAALVEQLPEGLVEQLGLRAGGARMLKGVLAPVFVFWAPSSGLRA